MKKILGLAFLALCTAAFTEVDSQYFLNRNILTNPGFENGKTTWTDTSSSTFNLISGPSSMYGNNSAIWSGTTAGQSLRSNSYTISQGLYGKTCLGHLSYRGGASTLTAEVLNGANSVLVNQSLLASGTISNDLSMYFPCPSAGTMKIGVKTNTTNSTSVILDDFYLGSFVGTSVLSTKASWAGYHASDCAWATASVAFTDPADDAACTFTQLSNTGMGTVSSTGAKSPGITFTPPRIGTYLVTVNIFSTTQIGSNYNAATITDGSNVELGTEGSALQNGGMFLSGILNVTSLSAQTVKIRVSVSGGTGTFGVSAAGNNASLSWTITEL